MSQSTELPEFPWVTESGGDIEAWLEVRDAKEIADAFRAYAELAIASVKREPLDLMPVILWLENGCDPIEAAKELRLYQAAISAGKG